MLGWFSEAIARASRSKRSPCVPWSVLMATVRRRRVSVALYTSPMPPTPTGARTSYGPRRVPGGRGNPFDALPVFQARSQCGRPDPVAGRGEMQSVVGQQVWIRAVGAEHLVLDVQERQMLL